MRYINLRLTYLLTYLLTHPLTSRLVLPPPLSDFFLRAFLGNSLQALRTPRACVRSWVYRQSFFLLLFMYLAFYSEWKGRIGSSEYID